MSNTETTTKEASEAAVIMEHIIDTYGIQPFMNESGQLGLYFNELSASRLSEFSLLNEVDLTIDGYTNPATGQLGWEGRDDVLSTERALKEALAKVSEALANIESEPRE